MDDLTYGTCCGRPVNRFAYRFYSKVNGDVGVWISSNDKRLILRLASDEFLQIKNDPILGIEVYGV